MIKSKSDSGDLKLMIPNTMNGIEIIPTTNNPYLTKFSL